MPMPDLTTILVVVVVFFAIFVQSVSGFGLGLVAMPFLIRLLGPREAAPLVSLVGMAAGFVMLARYHADFHWGTAWRLALPCLVGIPLGVYGLRALDERFIMIGLGVVVTGYGLYGLIGWQVPSLRHQAWAVGLGLLAGLLSGAYNIGGPPLIIYGHANHWKPFEFKGNLQLIFMLMGFMTIGSHAASGNFTPAIWNDFLLCLPALVLAFVAGFSLDRVIDQVLFQRILLGLLIILGIVLVV